MQAFVSLLVLFHPFKKKKKKSSSPGKERSQEYCQVAAALTQTLFLVGVLWCPLRKLKLFLFAFKSTSRSG